MKISVLSVCAMLLCVFEPLSAQLVRGSGAVVEDVLVELHNRAQMEARGASLALTRRDSLQDSLLVLISVIAHSERCLRTTPGAACDHSEGMVDSLWQDARLLNTRSDSLITAAELHRSMTRRLTVAMSRLRGITDSGSNLLQSAASHNRDLYREELWMLDDIAGEFFITARPAFISVPQPGGVVLYQTSRSRERNEEPRSLPELTNSRPQELIVGCYFFWIRRGNRDTSDRNREVCIEKNTPEVTLNEY